MGQLIAVVVVAMVVETAVVDTAVDVCRLPSLAPTVAA
jgi:hypothetical protein